MQELNDERVLFAFARDLEPALTVASGETVRIRTQDCFGNQVQTPEDELDEINWDRINPATGPVFVEGAVPGGALKVTIENIELDPQTASCTGKDEGVCGDRFDAWSTHLCAIDGDKLVWNDQLSIPLNPMIGVIGVAPAGDPVNCGTPGSHGGNMDNTAITTGATLYFPVAVEGALFGCGDMHAAMGDGEISVSGARWPATLRSRSLRCPTCTWLIRLSRTARTSASSRPPSLSTQRPIAPCTRWWICCTTAPASTRPSWLCCCRWWPTCKCARWWIRRRPSAHGSQVRVGIAGVQAVVEEKVVVCATSACRPFVPR